ncbi:hypothetical protein AAHC03_09230 [Spirometra sp. Aus1]
MPKKEAVFVPGEAIFLPCKVSASPPPVYRWKKNGKDFNWAGNIGRYTKWPDEGTIVLAKPGTDDDGLYQCFAENKYGVAVSNTINVKRAEMGKFEPSPVVTLSARIGDSLSLPCEVPIGFPPPIVTWQTKRNAQLEYIKETNRLATDINGYLHIAAVIPSDDGVVFQCVANNEVMREQTTGPAYLIRAFPPEVNRPVSFVFQTPFTTLAVAGSVLRLQCILAGNPLPSYTWFKDGKDATLHPNVNILNMGTVLEINPVSNTTAGQYRCQGVNEALMTTKNYEYQVTVKSAPTFTKFPVDTSVPENGSVVFTCEATADPRPKIWWTVNGRDPSFYLDGVRKLISGNSMILNNLTVDDIAVIQCNASNSFGYVFVNAYVNVLREPPFIYEPPQSQLHLVDGASALITCRSYSAPKALVSWKKDGRPINGGRYQIQPNGDLAIEAVASTDSGDYECTATNPFGVTKASGHLTVRRRTRVTLAPIETWVYEGQLVKFVCTAETDPMEVDNLVVRWYKDGNLIDTSATPRIEQIGFDYSLLIAGAQALDTGQYRCNASNGLDFAFATASLLVQGRPNQPRGITIDCINFADKRQALVNWAPGSDNYAPIIEYIVEFSTQFERQTWYRAELFNTTGLLHAADAKVILRPNIDYRFRVRTRNRVGLSEPSTATTETCMIPATAPATNPRELFVYGTQANNLIIQWSTMPFVEHYGNNLVYLLTVRCLNCNNIRPTDVNTTVIGNWRTDRITYTVFQSGTSANKITQPIESYKLFEATIQSRNDKGTSTAIPTVAQGYSGENMPNIAPPAPTVLQATSTGAVLQWTVITQQQEVHVNGFFRGYRVEWCPSKLTTTECEKEKRFQDVLLQMLPTPVSYLRRPRSLEEQEVDEVAGTSDHIHRYSRSDDCESLTDACPVSPFRSPSCVGEAVQFQLARSPRQLVTMTTLPDARSSITPIILQNFTWGQAINYTLTGVPGATEIRLWLRILNSLNAGPMSSVVNLTTLEGIPGPVAELQTVMIGINKVNVTWSAPREPNGVVIGYEFEAREIIGLDLAYATRYPTVMDGSLTTYEMTALRPNTTYRLIVIPRTKAGAGIEAFLDIATLDATIAPAPPTFFVSNIADTTFNITYEPSHRGLPGSVFFAQYREPGVIQWQESLREFIKRTFYITQLTPSTQYEVRMVATNGADLSAASTSIFVWTTGPPVPGGLQGASATWFVIVFLIFLLLVFFFVLFACIRNQRLKEVQEKAAPTEHLFEPSEVYPGAPSQMNRSLPLGDLEEDGEAEEEERNRGSDDARQGPEGVEEAVESVRSAQHNAYDSWSPERRQQQRRPYYGEEGGREGGFDEVDEADIVHITPRRGRSAGGRAWRDDERLQGAPAGPASDLSGYIDRGPGGRTAYERESTLSGGTDVAASSSISGLHSDRRRQRPRNGRNNAGVVNQPTFI